ncbi:G protein-coupled receptor 88 [Scleropages formosus]|uniref:G protein-coupled receptor 88 n=1 Tax=Scleropages formosus TaxID=113540 RepID=A0A8C9V6S4_SCLFO|nr:probable G-protein coupled receptor 88 [Scleropages formosus]
MTMSRFDAAKLSVSNDSQRLGGCEVDSATKISLASLYTFMSLLGTALSALVVYLVLCFKTLRTASNAFIVNGCVADLLVCACWAPHEALLASGAARLAPGHRAFAEALLFLGVSASLLSHSLVAVNRYVLITRAPATYVWLYQRRHARWMIAASWLLSLGGLLPCLASSRHPPAEGCAHDPSAPWSVLSNSPCAQAILALTILSQSVVLLFCYFKIFRKVQMSMKRVSVLNFQIVNNLPYTFPRRDRRLGLYVLAVCCVFLLGTEPLLWVLLVGFWGHVPPGARVASWGVFCALFVLNPFLYTWKNEEFRRSFRSALRGDLCSGPRVDAEPTSVHTVAHLSLRQNSTRMN